MTSTVPRTEDGLLESVTVQDEWAEELMQDWHGFRSQPVILISHRGVGTSLLVPMVNQVYAGLDLPVMLPYVVPCIEPFAQGSTGSSNDTPQAEEVIKDHLDRLIALSAEEVFFDGMESRLSFGLKRLLGAGSIAAIRVIRSRLNSRRLNAEVTGEILRVLGDFEDLTTHQGRLSVLLECLGSEDSRIRDAASIGIAAMDDPSALQEVEKAVEFERLPELKEDLQLVVDQLRRWTMPTFLRVVQKSRWHSKPEWNGWQSGDLQGDALLDLQTKGNALSVYHVGGVAGVDRVVTALAATRQFVSNLDYVVFDDAPLASSNIDFVQSNGETPDKGG